LQFRGSDYTATNGTSITGLTALVAGDVVEVIAPSAAQFGDYYTQAQTNSTFLTQATAASTYATQANFPAGAWTAYTPTFTNFTLGNGTISFAYTQIGKTVHMRGIITLGTTSSITGTFTLSPPTSVASSFGQPNIGQCRYVDISPSISYGGNLLLTGGSTMVPVVYNVAGTYPTIGGINSTTPITWVSTDQIVINATYQAG
jgi:hypothetical protein